MVSTTTRLVAKVSSSGGRLSTAAPVTLKNQIQEIRSIQDIADVAEIDVTSGATIIYNATNDKYEVRQLQTSDLASFNLDGGSF